MWIQHFFSLFGRIASNFFGDIGTTWLGLLLGIVFGLATVAATAYRVFKLHGWGAMLSHWRQDAGVALRISALCASIVYTPIFMWEVGKTVYQDHQNLVALSHSQKGLIEQDDLRRRLAVDKEDQKLVSCGTEKASLQGANGVLSNQNRDQQNTINNCQTQALKLLAPEPLKVVPLLLEPGNGGMEMQHVEFLLLTNRVITPINLVVSCQDRIADLNASIVGSGVTAGGSSRISKNQFQVNISSPAWGPEAPMIISMSFIGYSDNPCSFNER